MSDVPQPPDDAEEWSDEEWIAYLEATDPDATPGGGRPVTRLGRLAARPGAKVVGVAMTTLGEIIYGRKEKATPVAIGAARESDEEFDIELEPEGHIARVYLHNFEASGPDPSVPGAASGDEAASRGAVESDPVVRSDPGSGGRDV